MEKILIFTDSSADIPRAVCEEYGIEIVPITLVCDGTAMREHLDVTPQEYWRILESCKQIPTTAQATPAMFTELFESAAARGYTHVLGILINSAGSGTFQSACLAQNLFAQQHGEGMQITLLDSRTYTYIYGAIVVEAARMRIAGESFEAICAVAKSHLARAECILGVYTLKYLKASGRISGAAAFVGEKVGLRPLCLVRNGAVTTIDKIRGDKNVAPGIAALVKKRAVNPARQTAHLLYGDVPEERIAALEQALLADCGFARVKRSPIGGAVLTNTGPYALAVSYQTQPWDDTR